MARFRVLSDQSSRIARQSALIVLAAVLTILVAAMSLSEGTLVPNLTRPPAPQREARPPVAEDELRTGAIIVAPADGNLCEHRVIDNRTGRITVTGRIACDNALASPAHGAGGRSQARIEAIRDGFFQKR